MEEYLRILLEQIRCRQAHGAIRDEMEAHIRQQIEDNIASGMSMEQAEKAAVLDMGSPVETGIALDRIHRPQIAWKMILFITAITIAASVMHILLGTQEYVCGAAVGLVLMIFMYRLDYTRIAEFAKTSRGSSFDNSVCLFAYGRNHVWCNTIRSGWRN